MLRIALACLVLVTVCSVRADENSFDPSKIGPDCNLGDGGMQQMNVCAGRKAEAADKKMNLLYQQLMTRLSESSRTKLRASQREWLKYRDDACDYEVDWAGPCQGTICPYEQSLCVARLTNQRIEILQSYVDCTSNGCPE